MGGAGWWTKGGTTRNNQVNLLATFFFHFHSRAKRPPHTCGAINFATCEVSAIGRIEGLAIR